MAKTSKSGTTRVSTTSKSGRTKINYSRDQRSAYAYKLNKQKMKQRHAEKMSTLRHQVGMIKAKGTAGAKTIAAYKGGEALEAAQEKKYEPTPVQSVNTFQNATLNNKELDLRDNEDDTVYREGGTGMY